MKMLRTSLSALLLTAACLGASPALAQFSQDNSAPIDGSADQALYQKDKIVLKGQVDVRQAESRILADQMNIYSQTTSSVGQAFENIDRIEAIGNFYYITPDQEVRGSRGLYQQAENTFTVSGDVILLQQDGSVVTGENLVYNLGTEEAKMTGSCRGRKCGKTGRVRILIKNTGGAGSSVQVMPGS